MSIPARSNALFSFVQLNFALCVGGAFFVGHGLIISYLILAPLAFFLLFQRGLPVVRTSEMWLFALMISYYLYFTWRELASPYHLPSLDFLRENFPFFVAPFLILAFRKMDIDEIFKWMANWCIVLIAIVLIVSAQQKGGVPTFRASFTSDNPLTLSMFVLSGVYISLAEFRNRKGWLNVGLGLVTWLLGLAVIAIYSDSRMATFLYLLCAGLFIAYCFCSVKFSWQKNLTRLLIIAIVGLLTLSTALYVIVELNIMPRLAGLVEFVLTGQRQVDDSTFQRTLMWQEFMAHWRDIPFFGVGPENPFAFFVENYGIETPFRHFHNDFIDHFTAGGYIGAMFFFALVIAPLLYLFSKSARDDRFIYLVFIIFASFTFSGLTNRIMFHPERVAWYVYLLMFLQIYFDQLSEKRRLAVGTQAR